MKRPMLKLPSKAKIKTTAQQGQDFTAEGAPPPGRVGLGPPVEATEPEHLKARAATETTPAGAADAGARPR